MMDRTRLLIATFTIGSCLWVSCTKKSASDQSLVAAIQSKLYADDSTKSANIKVDAKNGVVTLSGDVPSSDVELEAMKVANATPGVSSVSDQLKVNAAAATAPPANPTTAANTSQPPASGSYPPVSPAPAPAPVAAAPPPQPKRQLEDSSSAVADNGSAPAPRVREASSLTVPAGSRLQVRMIDAIDSKKNSVGQTFNGTLEAPLVHGNRVVVPAGAPVTVALSDVSSAGRVKGRSELQVRVTGLTAGGRNYEIASDVYDQTGAAKGKQTAVRSGIGAAAGALIGGLAGGEKGAAIGAGAGGGAGLGYQFFTHGAQVKIPSESVLTFKLAEPLTVRR